PTVAQRDPGVQAGDVAVVGEVDLAALAAERDALAEERERRARDVAADDYRELAPEARVRATHQLCAAGGGVGRRDALEAQQFLADADDLAALQFLFLRHLDELPVQAVEVAHDCLRAADVELRVDGREIAVVLEHRAEAATELVLSRAQ